MEKRVAEERRRDVSRREEDAQDLVTQLLGGSDLFGHLVEEGNPMVVCPVAFSHILSLYLESSLLIFRASTVRPSRYGYLVVNRAPLEILP